MFSPSESSFTEELPEEAVVCRCSNVCNRASGRGCCPCLARSRKCSGLCRCGTAKMLCKNKPADIESTQNDEDDGEEDSAEEILVRRRMGDLDEDNLTERGKRGRKRKIQDGSSSGLLGRRSKHTYKKEWEQFPEFCQWLTSSNTSGFAYCVFCECELNVSPNLSSLSKHGKNQRHVKSGKLWKNKYKYTTSKGQAITEAKRRVLEDIPEFKPWLRLHPVTGSAYCLHCKMEIKEGETLDILRGHKKLKKHMKIAAKMEEASESEEEVRISLEERRTGQAKNGDRGFTSYDSEQCDSGVDGGDYDDDGDDLEAGRGSSHLAAESLSQQMKETEAKILTFMVENDVPVMLTDSLVSMLKGLPSVGMSLKRLMMDNGMAANMMRQNNDSFLSKVLVERLKKTLFYILIDVRPGSSGQNHVGIFVAFCNTDLSTQIELLDVKDCGEVTAETIYTNLTESLKQKEQEGVPLSHWMGFLCHTSSVTFHVMFSVMAMVAAEYQWVSPLVCPRHMAELSFATACKSLPENVEHLCHLVHTHFRSGPKQAVSFLDYKEFCSDKHHGILNAKDVPWLAMYDFLWKLLDQWQRLKTYFSCLMMTEPDEQYNVVLEMFSNPLMKVLILVVKFALDTIKTYNSKVLAGEPLFPNLNEDTNELIRTFANFFLKSDVVAVTEDLTKLCVTDEETYLPLPQIYLGLEASDALSSHMEQNQLSFEDPNIVGILHNIRRFYREFITHLQVSLQMSQPMQSMVSLMNPQNAVNVESPVKGESFTTFSHSDLIDATQLEGEWRSVCNIELPSSEMLQSPLQYWKHVLSQKTEGFKNLQCVLSYFFSLPVLHLSEGTIFKFLKDWNLEAWMNLKSANMWAYRNTQSKLSKTISCNGQTGGWMQRKDAA